MKKGEKKTASPGLRKLETSQGDIIVNALEVHYGKNEPKSDKFISAVVV